ncbi:MAG TPA: metallophosphoesterase [Flavisolibacter sp.]|nr:metallophosphoesterase [Flavisolibacter sp.]
MTRTIAYITDIHLDEAYLTEIGVNPKNNWKRILDDIQARGIGSIIFGGDIGEPAANAWFFDSLKTYELDITLGNHDTFMEVSRHFKKKEWQYQTAGYYTNEDAHWKYVFLDSSTNAISLIQQSWLAQELTTEKPLLVFIHHPIFPVDTPVDRAYPLQEREQLQQLLQKRTSPTTIFCGHYHLLDEQHKGMIRQYITPAASYQMVKEAAAIQTDNSTFGYRIISVAKDKVSSEVITFNKEVE